MTKMIEDTPQAISDGDLDRAQGGLSVTKYVDTCTTNLFDPTGRPLRPSPAGDGEGVNSLTSIQEHECGL